jgi:hypothetical protein
MGFDRRPDLDDHVAMSKMAEVMPMMLGWRRAQLQRGPRG